MLSGLSPEIIGAEVEGEDGDMAEEESDVFTDLDVVVVNDGVGPLEDSIITEVIADEARGRGGAAGDASTQADTGVDPEEEDEGCHGGTTPPISSLLLALSLLICLQARRQLV